MGPMYVNLKEILDDAARNGYAVLATSPINMELARGMVMAAEEKNAPIIFLLGQNMMKQHAKAELVIPMIRKMAEEYASVPIATCLDHGNDEERILYAFRNGFSSIMYDGSLLSFDENVKRTKAVARMCHSFDMGVEGELGHVGVAASGDGRDESLYTSPEDARTFVQETHVDCLAVAVGTAHGEYPKGMVPHINFKRIEEIKDSTGGMPIALHGGSGSGDENITKAVKAGINKVNMVSDVLIESRKFLSSKLQENPGIAYIDLMSSLEGRVKEFISHWIDLTGSEGKGSLFKVRGKMGLLSPSCKIGNGE